MNSSFILLTLLGAGGRTTHGHASERRRGEMVAASSLAHNICSFDHSACRDGERNDGFRYNYSPPFSTLIAASTISDYSHSLTVPFAPDREYDRPIIDCPIGGDFISEFNTINQ